MEINIAGERLLITVPFASQNAVRRTEKDIQTLYNDWRFKFAKKSDAELLAMIVYQYAYYYNDLQERYDRATTDAQKARDMLDSLLNKLDA